MPKKLITVAMTAAVIAAGGAGFAGPAVAAPAAAVARCHAHRVAHKNYWTCVTPGSFCPAAAHKHYGYAAKTGKRYRCLVYPNGRWRWKRA